MNPTAFQLAYYMVTKNSTSNNPLVDNLLIAMLADELRKLGYE